MPAVEATLDNRDPSAFKAASDTLESLVREVLRAGEANLLTGPSPASVLAESRWYARAEAALLRTSPEIERLRADSRRLVAHWNEFGPEHGFDELIEGVSRRLRACEQDVRPQDG